MDIIKKYFQARNGPFLLGNDGYKKHFEIARMICKSLVGKANEELEIPVNKNERLNKETSIKLYEFAIKFDLMDAYKKIIKDLEGKDCSIDLGKRAKDSQWDTIQKGINVSKSFYLNDNIIEKNNENRENNNINLCENSDNELVKKSISPEITEEICNTNSVLL